jgi:hypothetical protein
MNASMPARSQLTLRVDERLARDLKRVAAQRGLSLNAFAAQTLAAAIDPETADSDMQRTRERLARAGILADTGPPVDYEPLPEEEFERLARKAGSRGPTGAELVSMDREEGDY